MLRAKTLMIQGTGSGVGKSLVAAALCRLLNKRGIRVAPFKAQNMSNNASVADDGGEIARAQAMQAECAGVPTSVDMNPVLLKPHSDTGAQVIVQGRAWGHMGVRDYHRVQKEIFQRVKESFARLLSQFEVVVIEGAGSPAEVNIARYDFANMKIARLADSPVLVVGDIDRCGVFASLYGTYALLEPADRRRVRGFLINKFRGDPALLHSGMRFLEKKTHVPVLGVIPYIEDLYLDEEDSLALNGGQGRGSSRTFDITVIRFPRISNFTDFKPLELEPRVRLRYCSRPLDFGHPDLLILPGTKSTLQDLEFLKKQGLWNVIRNYASKGGCVLGICGGLQILGEVIEDPKGIEGPKRIIRGLGLLPVRTRFEEEKVVRKTEAMAEWRANGHTYREKVSGYEIHMGRTEPLNGMSGNRALLWQGNVYGTYLHGLFDRDGFRRKFVRSLGKVNGMGARVSSRSHEDEKEKSYQRLARAVEDSVNLKRVWTFVGVK